ncbi:MAG TPA: NAD-dependent malic enzyme [Sutterella sp.]|nr:NAD-dependent malic enzyme [Sutterella sp.]
MNFNQFGLALIHNPLLNKGTAFSLVERHVLHLEGLLPPVVESLKEQSIRTIEHLRKLEKPIDKYVSLDTLHNTNETLYFRVLTDYIDELMPIVYTPTVGEACQKFSHIFQQARGLYITIKEAGRIEKLLDNTGLDDVEVIVVTDGERILGLGDQGANGMGIPIGKLSLYTACAGFAPDKCLPVTIDVGTNNENYLNDPLYFGLKNHRVTGEAYDRLIDEFVEACRRKWPNVLIQFEDFANKNAFSILNRWRDKTLCFNDDIQGTACVGVAGLFSALRVTGGKLDEQRLLFLGAGEAATGVAKLFSLAVAHETGQSFEDATKTCYLFDSKGLVVSSRDDLAHQKAMFKKDMEPCTDFLEAVKRIRPTAIIGLAAKAGAFDEAIISEMAKINERPIIFALSNPTSKAECTAQDAYQFSDGKALFASGSPFDPVEYKGQTFVSRQGNNAYVFPGLGKGASVSRARVMSEEMFLIAAETLSGMVTEEDLAKGALYPPLSRIREISFEITCAIARYACENGMARVVTPDDIEETVRRSLYVPEYY